MTTRSLWGGTGLALLLATAWSACLVRDTLLRRVPGAALT